MKLRRMRSFFLLLLILAIPILAFAEAGEMAIQEIPVSNTPIKGTVEINKWGSVLKGFSENRDTLGYTVHTPLYQDDRLPGAVYEVRAAEDIVGKDQTVWFGEGELAATITTIAGGSVATELLPLGRYIVTEVSAPAGYVLDDTPHEIALTAADHTIPVVTARLSAINEFMSARITLTKEKEIVTTQHDEDGMVHSQLMNVPGEGFVFGLYCSDPIEYAGGTLPADTLIETGITDSDGALTFSGDYPHGEYYVQELAAPEGWVLSDARYRVTITDEFADEQHEVAFQVGLPIHNEIVHADVRIAKTDITGSAALPGALIEVRNRSGEIVCRDYTGEDGYLPAFPAVPGTYTYCMVYEARHVILFIGQHLRDDVAPGVAIALIKLHGKRGIQAVDDGVLTDAAGECYDVIAGFLRGGFQPDLRHIRQRRTSDRGHAEDRRAAIFRPWIVKSSASVD